MSTWIWSGQTALVAGGVLFALLLIPLLSWQHRRYGQLSPARLVGSAGLTLYLVALVTYTWLPLPPRSQEWCAVHGVHGVIWRPFHFVGDITDSVRAHGLTGAATTVTVLQVAFNVLLFVPWGVFVRGFLHRSRRVATFSALAASVLIEATQATGLWGIYPCAYRWADIDDVLTNTLGGALGALLAPAIVWWMPHTRALSARRLAPRPVTIWRRWTGMAVDLFCAWAVSTGVTLLFRVARIALGLDPMGDNDGIWLLPLSIAPLLVFWVPAWHGGGGGSGSTGHNAVWLTPAWRTRSGEWSDGTRVRRLARATIVPGPFLLAAMMPEGLPRRVMFGIAVVTMLVAIAMVLFTRGGRSLSGVLTGAEMRDIRSWDAERSAYGLDDARDLVGEVSSR